jgi:hypothetical protein
MHLWQRSWTLQSAVSAPIRFLQYRNVLFFILNIFLRHVLLIPDLEQDAHNFGHDNSYFINPSCEVDTSCIRRLTALVSFTGLPSCTTSDSKWPNLRPP